MLYDKIRCIQVNGYTLTKDTATDSFGGRLFYQQPLPHWRIMRILLCIGVCLAVGSLILWRWTISVVAQQTTQHTIYLPAITNKVPSPTPPSEPASDDIASFASTVVVTADDATVWVANPDVGSLSLIDSVSLQKQAEIAVGTEPWSIVLSPDNQTIYTVDRANGTLVLVDTQQITVTAVITVGAEPESVALSPSGKLAYVTVKASAEVVLVDVAKRQIIQRIATAPMPFAIGVTDDGDNEDNDETVVVTHLFAFLHAGGEEARDDGREGRVTLLPVAEPTQSVQISLTADANGFPNLLAHLALVGQSAWIPQVRAAPDLPNELTSMVFAAVSMLDLAAQKEDTQAKLPLNDQDIFGSPVNNPVAVAPSPDGQTLYVVLAGNDLIEAIAIAQLHQPRLLRFLPVGKNPRGMAISHDGKRGYVMNYLSRSLTVLDLQNSITLAEIATTEETLPADVLHGKILFNNAVNPKLSHGSWQSCASCHPDGGSDSVTWIFPDGPRQTPPLWNAVQTLPWHWSAALDEAQDVEDTIQRIQHGIGLAPDSDPALLGIPNAGRSAELDALAAYLQSGIRSPNLSLETSTDTSGRSLFISEGCAACHGGANWTSSKLAGSPGTLDSDGNSMVDSVLRNVGTLNARDIRGSLGFDPPSLLAVGLNFPYFHDGSTQTLEALLASGHPNPEAGKSTFTEEEIQSLVHFLRQIDAQTEPITIP